MSIWNPYVFRPDGEAIGPVAPPALRVIGAPATAAQLGAAQAAFAAFCERARLSVVPNPTEFGALPDGSAYKIVVVGCATTMLLWPKGVGEAQRPLKGVGVEADFPGGPQLFVLSYRSGQWGVQEAKEFFGGSGVWAGTSGRYLTDDTLSGRLEAPRHFKPGTALSPQNTTSTSISRGMAYGRLGPGGVGVFTQGGKYAHITAGPSTRAEIAEGPTLSDETFALTPDTPAAVPAPFISISAQNGAGLNVVDLAGRAKYTRLRDGSATCFPVVTSTELAPGDLKAGDWLSQAPLTHEMKVLTPASGAYAIEIDPLGLEVTESWAPAKPVGVRTPWTYSLEETFNVSDYAVVQGAWDFVDQVVPGPVATQGRTITTRATTFSRGSGWSRPVYLARSWNDERVVMEAVNSESHNVVTSYEYKATNGYANVSFGGDPKLNPPEKPDGSYIDPQFGKPIFPTFPIADWPSTTIRGSYRHTILSVLKTPWGDLPLVDQDVTYSQTLAWSTDPSNPTSSLTASASGHEVRRFIKFIDPVLELIGFLEIRTGGYLPAGDSLVRTANSSAEFVLQHAGSDLLRFGLMGVQENSDGGDPFQYVAGISSPPDGRVVSTTHVPVTFPFRWLELVPVGNGLEQVKHIGQCTVDCGYGSYTYSGGGFTNVAADISPVVPSPSLPNELFGVSVKSALDPNSGGGAVIVYDGNALKGAWLIAPDRSVSPLATVLTKDGQNPTNLKNFVVSV